jgi:MHS family proline/betaine transporter-like MFS transporter
MSGALSDVVGRRACLLAAYVLSLCLAYPFISLMIGAPVGTVVLLHVAFAAINGLFLGALASALVEMFPTARRMTGLTTACNLQSTLFGGFAPFIASWLIAATGQPISTTCRDRYGVGQHTMRFIIDGKRRNLQPTN